MQNELGMDVPPAVAKKAKKMGCNQGVRYVYKDGVYGDGFPASSIGGKRASRFGNIDSANANKVSLGNGWVAFHSPSHGGVKVSSNSTKPSSKKTSSPTKKSKSTPNKPTQNKDRSESSNSLSIKRETEFFHGFIRLKLSVTNKKSLVLTDIRLDFHFDEKTLRIDRFEPEYPSTNGKVELGNIQGKTAKSIVVYFEPMVCSKGTMVDCIITYKDATGQLLTTKMRQKRIEVTCPILKSDSQINIAKLCQLIDTLPSKDRRIYGINSDFDMESLKNNLLEVIHKYDINHLRTLHTTDDKYYEMWFYSKTKVRNKNIVLKLTINSEDRYVELFVATMDAKSLTGLLAELGRAIRKMIEKAIKQKEHVYQIVNVNITDSVIQRSNLLSYCDNLDSSEGDIVIEESLIQRSSISGNSQ